MPYQQNVLRSILSDTTYVSVFLRDWKETIAPLSHESISTTVMFVMHLLT